MIRYTGYDLPDDFWTNLQNYLPSKERCEVEIREINRQFYDLDDLKKRWEFLYSCHSLSQISIDENIARENGPEFIEVTDQFDFDKEYYLNRRLTPISVDFFNRLTQPKDFNWKAHTKND